VNSFGFVRASTMSFLFVCGLLMNCSSARAGCVSDCRDDFDSAVQSCKLTYDDPDDSEDLEICMNSARSEYEDCIAECTS
jgi:hypothetical protein